MPDEKRKQWEALGYLTKAKKGIDLSFWRIVLFINFSWKGWEFLKSNGDIHRSYVSIHAFKRISTTNKVLVGYALIFFPLTISIGWRPKYE